MMSDSSCSINSHMPCNHPALQTESLRRYCNEHDTLSQPELRLRWLENRNWMKLWLDLGLDHSRTFLYNIGQLADKGGSLRQQPCDRRQPSSLPSTVRLIDPAIEVKKTFKVEVCASEENLEVRACAVKRVCEARACDREVKLCIRSVEIEALSLVFRCEIWNIEIFVIAQGSNSRSWCTHVSCEYFYLVNFEFSHK